MSTPGIRFIKSNTPGSGFGVGVGLSAIVGPTGPAGAFGGPQGNIGIQGFQGLIGYSTGTQGLVGPTGSIGLQGKTGSSGLQGLVGSTGPSGIQGLIGLQGLQGIQGFQGFQGLQGLQGLIGPTGTIGLQGSAGMGFTVFANTNSYTGLNQVIATGGNIGQFVLVLGGQLFVYAGTGSGYTGPGNSYGYAGDVTDESKLVGMQGNMGYQGLQGVQGLQGLAGNTGINGSQGLQGLIGATGTNGNQGLQGLAGSTGINGNQGLQGLAGTTGTNGSQGLQGLIGATGPSNPGVQGLAGGTGPTGALGLQGSLGFQGPAGVSIGSLANVKLSYTRTTDSPNFSISGNKLYAFSGATGGINNTTSSNITFTPSNGRFTVSEQGDYYLDARLIIKGSNNPDFITTDVYVNTGTVYNYTHVAYGIVSPVGFPIGLYLPLNAGDYVNIACYSTGTNGPITMKAGSTINMFRITNGPTGSIGVQGYQGHTGLQGYQGETGMQGLQGYQGHTGYQGYQGYQGHTGLQGYQGETGMQGLQGYQGSTGPRGATGAGVQGPAGQDSSARFQYRYNTATTNSDPGPSYFKLNNSTMSSATALYIDVIDYDPPAYPGGNDITDFLLSLSQYGSESIRGVIKIEKAVDSTWYQSYNFSTVTNNSGWFTITLFNIIEDANFTNNDTCYISFILAGPRGATGPSGGPAGPQGFVGATGSQGFQGLVGLQGVTGPSNPGVQGFQGFTGDRGFQGPTGTIGLTGLQGSTGGFGPQGFTGDRGLQGFQGSTGSIGPQGGVGMGFVVFANTTSYTGLNQVIATGGNIGQFVLVLGGDLFVYAGTGSGYTGPGNSYGYAGDITDETKLVGMQGFQGFQGSTGPGFSTIANPGSGKVLLSTGSSSNSAVAYDNLNYNGTTLSAPGIAVSTLAVTGTFQFGTPPQIFYPYGANGFSVNENFDASNSSTQTAYHYTSGDQTRNIVFDLAVTNQYTTMFGTHGNASSNEFVIGSETSNTDFVFKQGLGIQPIDLAGGTQLLKISSVGSLTIPNGNAPENLSDSGDIGQLAWDDNNFYVHTNTTWEQIPYGGVTGPQGLIGPQGIAGPVSGKSSQFIFNQSGAATGSNNALTYLESSTGSIIYAGSSIIPTTTAAYNLGSPDNLWKSIYISTGTIFIGPTGTLGLDNNGVISSSAGFSSPFITVGSTNPGNGITLYNNQNKLYFQNQSGATGPVSNWNITTSGNIYFTGANVGIGTSSPSYPLQVKGTTSTENINVTNGVAFNTSSTSRKYYSVNNVYTGTNSPLDIQLTFTNYAFKANATAFLQNKNRVNDLSTYTNSYVGGTYDGSTPSNNIVSFGPSILNNPSTAYTFTGPSSTTTPTIVHILSSESISSSDVVVYSINIEVIKGTLSSITDSVITTNFNY